jgi:release factor glutamine methyltransferase
LLQSEWAASLAATAPRGPILELCAGAGHIGLVAAFLSGRHLIQVEADPVAASFAAQNAERAGWLNQTEIRVERLQSAIRSGERFPIMIADPPYLRSEEVQRWPEDPVTAIDGGVDGLSLIRDCLEVAAASLEQGGQFLLQVRGSAQAEQLGVVPGLRRRELRVVDDKRAVLRLARK